MNPNFQLESDLHLEFGVPPLLNKRADILILAGDICTAYTLRHDPTSQTFFENVAKQWQDVVYIFGNHEYYGSSIAKAEEEIRKELAKYSNIHILQNESITINGTRFLGTTLWTDMDKNSAYTKDNCRKYMNDYRVISGLTPDGSIAIHNESVRWLTSQIDPNDTNTVVVTHHAPHFRSSSKEYANSKLNGAFYSDLKPLILALNAKFWCHGHMHTKAWYTIGKTEIWCNPTGYPMER